MACTACHVAAQVIGRQAPPRKPRASPSATRIPSHVGGYAVRCRRCVLIEQNPKYVALSKKRLAEPVSLRRQGRPKAVTTPKRVQFAARYTTADGGVALGKTQAERAAMAGISKSTQGKLDKLARERPDLLEQVQAGV